MIRSVCIYNVNTYIELARYRKFYIHVTCNFYYIFFIYYQNVNEKKDLSQYIIYLIIIVIHIYEN